MLAHRPMVSSSFKIKNATGKEQCWTIDLKKLGNVYKGKAQLKSDVTIMVSGTVELA